MLQQLLGDDEHTAIDGVYYRLIKGRKWLYFSSFFSIFEAYRLIDYGKISALIKGIVTIPSWLGRYAILAALAYALMQYTLLLFQAWEVYPSALRDRLNRGVNEDRDKFRKEEAASQEILQTATFARDEAQIALNRLADRKVPESEDDKRNYTYEVSKYRGRISHASSQIASAEESINVSRVRIQELESEPHQKRLGFVFSELMLDFMRLAPPYIVSIGAMAHLLVVIWEDAGRPHFYGNQ